MRGCAVGVTRHERQNGHILEVVFGFLEVQKDGADGFYISTLFY
jgi:hypothetical protein